MFKKYKVNKSNKNLKSLTNFKKTHNFLKKLIFFAKYDN